MRDASRSAAFLVVILLLATVVNVPHASAQTRRRGALELSVGTVSFIESSERFAGGAARIYLGPRFAVGPEVVHIWRQRHAHTAVTLSATIDFPPSPGDASFEVPYVVFGLGMLSASYRSGTTLSQSIFVGGGIRCVVRRFTIGADLRVGTPLHLRVSLNAGMRLGG